MMIAQIQRGESPCPLVSFSRSFFQESPAEDGSHFSATLCFTVTGVYLWQKSSLDEANTRSIALLRIRRPRRTSHILNIITWSCVNFLEQCFFYEFKLSMQSIILLKILFLFLGGTWLKEIFFRGYTTNKKVETENIVWQLLHKWLN